MKKTPLSITVAAVIAAVNTLAAGFTDISGHWAESAINTLAAAGVVDGVTDTEFVPDGTVTRAQYLKMIMETVDLPTAPYRRGECLDADAGDWFAPYLQGALDSGLIPSSMIIGYSDKIDYTVDKDGNATESKIVYSGAFGGNLPITREEMAVLTEYAYQYTRTVLTNETADMSNISEFVDGSNIDDWAAVSVKHTVANGFMEGMDDGTFRPLDSATRAQAATVILRVLNKENKSNE